MSRGTPIVLKCPKCKRGKYGRGRVEKGCRATGQVEDRVTRSSHSGHGHGGQSFYGHRGLVECLDCEHTWYSTHPSSGRVRAASRVSP